MNQDELKRKRRKILSILQNCSRTSRKHSSQRRHQPLYHNDNLFMGDNEMMFYSPLWICDGIETGEYEVSSSLIDLDNEDDKKPYVTQFLPTDTLEEVQLDNVKAIEKEEALNQLVTKEQACYLSQFLESNPPKLAITNFQHDAQQEHSVLSSSSRTLPRTLLKVDTKFDCDEAKFDSSLEKINCDNKDSNVSCRDLVLIGSVSSDKIGHVFVSDSYSVENFREGKMELANSMSLLEIGETPMIDTGDISFRDLVLSAREEEAISKFTNGTGESKEIEGIQKQVSQLEASFLMDELKSANDEIRDLKRRILHYQKQTEELKTQVRVMNESTNQLELENKVYKIEAAFARSELQKFRDTSTRRVISISLSSVSTDRTETWSDGSDSSDNSPGSISDNSNSAKDCKETLRNKSIQKGIQKTAKETWEANLCEDTGKVYYHNGSTNEKSCSPPSNSYILL